MMRILVYPHDLGIGGSQLNAIELAAGVRDLGHEVVVYGSPGPLVRLVRSLDLPFVPSPEPGRRPSVAVVRDLRRTVAERGIEVVHGYEWPPILEGRAATVGLPAAAVGTVMSMSVAPFIPMNLPLVVGTRQIAWHERMLGRSRLSVIEPPVDLSVNNPEIDLDVADFQLTHRIPRGFHVVIVSRLVPAMKLEGILDAVRGLPPAGPDIVLTIVGSGPAHAEVAAAAQAANRAAGRTAVVLTGELADPRPAYAMADVVLGMGGSALRAMAFGKPVVVQGERGFWRALTPDTLDGFRWSGWYGVGSGDGMANLLDALRPIRQDAGKRSALGAYALSVAEDFSLAAAADRQLAVYREAAAGLGGGTGDGLGPRDLAATARLVRYKGERLVQRIGGIGVTEDFNGRPVAAAGLRAPLTGHLIVYLAGVAWDGPEGTDRRLALALSRRARLLWVDPPLAYRPRSDAHRRSTGVAPRGAVVDDVAPQIARLRLTGPPGLTRAGLRRATNALVARSVQRAAAQAEAVTTIVANPLASFPGIPGATRILYVTDDWVEGSPLMGLSAAAVARQEERNARSAHAVFAVSPVLARKVESRTGATVDTLANGCTIPDAVPPLPGAVALPPGPIAAVVGQLNERLDLAVLESVAGLPLTLALVGGRKERDRDFGRRLGHLLERDNVLWVDQQPGHVVPAILSAVDVGLTPYADSAFNRASFPVKTLDYLAAGLRCVSTPNPAVSWLDTDLIEVASGPLAFTARVASLLTDTQSDADRTRRREFARAHTWTARSTQLLERIDALGSRSGAPAVPTHLSTVKEGDHA